jgi:hypothetical protein
VTTRLQHYQPTPEDRAWRLRRLGYYILQIALFLLVGFRVGPNLILFHSPMSPTPADFVPFTERFVPVIAAIKAYNRDYGKLPVDSYDLPPEYGPPNYDGPIPAPIVTAAPKPTTRTAASQPAIPNGN